MQSVGARFTLFKPSALPLHHHATTHTRTTTTLPRHYTYTYTAHHKPPHATTTATTIARPHLILLLVGHGAPQRLVDLGN